MWSVWELCKVEGQSTKAQGNVIDIGGKLGINTVHTVRALQLPLQDFVTAPCMPS